MRKIGAYEVALAGVSTALATLFLVVGTIAPVLLFTAYLVACVVLMLPLSKGFYGGYLFAYIATSVLTLLFLGAGFLFELLPFLLFFGLHPLVNELQLKYRWNKWGAFFVKALWFDGALYCAWRFAFDMTTAIALPHEAVIALLLVLGTALFYLYDYTTFLCRARVNALVARLLRKK